MTTDDLIETARDDLDATAYAGETLFAWREEGDVVIATDDDLAAYGALLLADPETAWESWAGTSLGPAGTVTAAGVARSYNTTGKGYGAFDLGALRDEAASAADIATVAAIDLLGPEIEALYADVSEASQAADDAAERESWT